jgi:hypothetical protein
MVVVFCKKLTSGICMYIKLIYFFVMHETFVRTVFEPLAKKHLPFFSCVAKKRIFIMPLLTKIYSPLLPHTFLVMQNDV